MTNMQNNAATAGLERLFDYAVADAAGEPMGTVSHVWLDNQTGAPRFIGARSGAIVTHTYVVPVQGAAVDDANRVVRLPFAAEFIKNAPNLSSSDDLTANDEALLANYYGSAAAGTASSSAAAAAAPGVMPGQPVAPAADGFAAANQPVPPGGAPASMPVGAPSPAFQPGAAPGGMAAAPTANAAGMATAATANAAGVGLRKVIRTERVYVPVEVQREYVVSDQGEEIGVQPPGAGVGSPDPAIASNPVPHESLGQRVKNDTTAAARDVADGGEQPTQTVRLDRSGRTV